MVHASTFRTIIFSFFLCFTVLHTCLHTTNKASGLTHDQILAEMDANTDLGKQLKQKFFGPHQSPFCAHCRYDTNSELCNYDIEIPYAIFRAKPVPNSVIEEVSFCSKQEMLDWLESHGPESTLVAYQPRCVGSFQLLTAMEPTAAQEEKFGKKTYKINIKAGQHSNFLRELNIPAQDTPTVWSLTGTPGNMIQEIDTNDVVYKILLRQHSHLYETLPSIWQETLTGPVIARSDKIYQYRYHAAALTAVAAIAYGVFAWYNQRLNSHTKPAQSVEPKKPASDVTPSPENTLLPAPEQDHKK